MSEQSLEYISSLYSLVLSELQNENTRDKHFNIIRNIFINYTYDQMKKDCNRFYRIEDYASLDYNAIWTIILGYIISATAKDFTLIIRLVESKSADFTFIESEL